MLNKNLMVGGGKHLAKVTITARMWDSNIAYIESKNIPRWEPTFIYETRVFVVEPLEEIKMYSSDDAHSFADIVGCYMKRVDSYTWAAVVTSSKASFTVSL